MATLMDALAWLRDALAGIADVQTCRIGFEPDVLPDAYPIARVVPLTVSRMPQSQAVQVMRQVEVIVYLGVASHDFEQPASETDNTGTEGLWRRLFDLESAVLAAIPKTGAYSARWIETVTDETMPEAERNPAFRMIGMRMVVMGLV